MFTSGNKKKCYNIFSVAKAVNEIVVCLDDPEAFADYMGTVADMHTNKNVVPAHFEVRLL